MTVVYKTYMGRATEGVIKTGAPLRQVCIFVETLDNLLGFRRSIPYKITETTDYYEVGHFMEMLYEGDPTAFRILHMPEEHVEHKMYDFEILQKASESLLSQKLLRNLLDTAKENFKLLQDPMKLNPKSDNKTYKVYLKEDFDNNNNMAYLCFRDVMNAISILETGLCQVSATKQGTLQCVQDGKFSITAIKEGFTMYLEKAEEMLDNSQLPEQPSLETMNRLLLKVRNHDKAIS